MKTKLIDTNRNSYIGIGSISWRYRDVKDGVYPNIVEIHSTGVEDDQGVVIYEGDIVECVSIFETDDPVEWVVRYHTPEARFKLFMIGDQISTSLYSVVERKKLYTLKVIGNINIKKHDKDRVITGIG